MVQQQFTAVYEDIFPDAVKIGMLCNEEIIEAVAETIQTIRKMPGNSAQDCAGSGPCIDEWKESAETTGKRDTADKTFSISGSDYTKSRRDEGFMWCRKYGSVRAGGSRKKIGERE